jgi:hypothetical protein
MAGCDYYNCDNCGDGKIFYDANTDWETYGRYIGQIRLICKKCYEDGYRINIVKGKALIPFTPSHNSGVHFYSHEFKKGEA